MVNKCSVCGEKEDLKPIDARTGIPIRELVDGAPYIKGLVCHDCDGEERAKHRIEEVDA